MMLKEYNLRYSYSARDDISGIKTYILMKFKYRTLGESFSQKIKAAACGLKTMPRAYKTIGFQYRGYDIFLKPAYTYLIFYVIDEPSHTVTILRVLQNGMDWQNVIRNWLKQIDS